MFKMTGVMNKDLFKQINKIRISIPGRILVISIDLFVAAMFILCLIARSYVYAVIFLAALISYALMHFWSNSAYVKREAEHLVEVNGKDEVRISVSFEDDGVLFENLERNIPTKYAYDHLKKIHKLKSVYFIRTKANYLIPVFVDSLSDAEKKELLSYLKAHAPQLKC